VQISVVSPADCSIDSGSDAALFDLRFWFWFWFRFRKVVSSLLRGERRLLVVEAIQRSSSMHLVDSQHEHESKKPCSKQMFDNGPRTLETCGTPVILLYPVSLMRSLLLRLQQMKLMDDSDNTPVGSREFLLLLLSCLVEVLSMSIARTGFQTAVTNTNELLMYWCSH